jgi:hypothetical protein
MPKITINDLNADAARHLRPEELVRITGGGPGDPIPTESISFNFDKMTKQKGNSTVDAADYVVWRKGLL